LSGSNSTVRLQGRTFTGGITNSGTILGNVPLFIITVSSFAGGITNSGTISGNATALSVSIVSNFSGGITNSGTIIGAFDRGLNIGPISTFSGGITNTGVISNGLFVQNTPTFLGNISNQGTILVRWWRGSASSPAQSPGRLSTPVC
jgi:hypothetical protein